MHDRVATLDADGIRRTTRVAADLDELDAKIRLVHDRSLARRERELLVQDDAGTSWTLFVTGCDTQETDHQEDRTHGGRLCQECTTSDYYAGDDVRSDMQAALETWTTALERRHMANLRVQDVTRALRALSSTYVERRDHGAGKHVHGALDTAGKRAAFAMYYGPLHFIAVAEVLHALGASQVPAGAILDLGCGTGAAGAAWALAAGGAPRVLGLDSHPWAVAEARWTFSLLGIDGRARQEDVVAMRPSRTPTSIVAAYTLNELPDRDRQRVEDRLIEIAEKGGHLLILEPLARRAAPWWPDSAARITALGGRADEWKIPIDAPEHVQRLGTAAGLNHREIRLQSLYL